MRAPHAAGRMRWLAAVRACLTADMCAAMHGQQPASCRVMHALCHRGGGEDARRAWLHSCKKQRPQSSALLHSTAQVQTTAVARQRIAANLR